MWALLPLHTSPYLRRYIWVRMNFLSPGPSLPMSSGVKCWGSQTLSALGLVTRPPPRLGPTWWQPRRQGHESCHPVLRGRGSRRLMVEQGLSWDSAFDLGPGASPDSAAGPRLTTHQLWDDEQVICPFRDSVFPWVKFDDSSSSLLGCLGSVTWATLGFGPRLTTQQPAWPPLGWQLHPSSMWASVSWSFSRKLLQVTVWVPAAEHPTPHTAVSQQEAQGCCARPHALAQSGPGPSQWKWAWGRNGQVPALPPPMKKE